MGVRLVRGEGGMPKAQYLVRWQDDYSDSWEDASNLSDDLLRRFEERWWRACKKGDYDTMVTMLMSGKEALVAGVDDGSRSALHYAAGIGNERTTELLLANGAEVDLKDKDGYTPLHIAAGYMHRPIVRALLDRGADPEIADAQGRTALELVESLRDNLPPRADPQLMSRRMQLTQVIEELYSNLYEEVDPLQILEARAPGDTPSRGVAEGVEGAEVLSLAGRKREFLVAWADGSSPSWVPAKHVADDVVCDFDAGLEYGQARRIVDKRVVTFEANMLLEGREETRSQTEYLIEWEDDYPDSWEVEGNVNPAMRAEFDGEDTGSGEIANEGARADLGVEAGAGAVEGVKS